MRVKWRNLLSWAIEKGAAAGVNRAYKHTDSPSREEIRDEVERAIWLALDEFLEVEDEEVVL